LIIWILIAEKWIEARGVRTEFSSLRMEREEQVLIGACLERVLHSDVWVIHEFLKAWSHGAIVLQARIEERETLQREAKRLREEIFAAGNVFSEIGLACACEGCVTCKHFVEDAAK